MAFLRKYYEKIILAAFLLVFITLLVWLISIFSKSLQISDEDLMIRFVAADYQQADENNFKAVANLAEQTQWLPAQARTPGGLDFSALLIPFEMAQCPVDKGCGRFIPLRAFGSADKPGRCPLCATVLEPPKLDEAKDPRGNDSDGDGIPDVIELKYGMNSTNAADAAGDLDDDGFSNLYEYQDAKTELNDAKSRPASALRLALKGIRRRQLPLQLKRVTVSPGDENDNSKWDIQADVSVQGRLRSRFWRLGQEIELDGEVFKIVGVQHKIQQKFNPRLNADEAVDVSEMIIQRDDQPQITAVVGAKVFEPNPQIQLTDYHTGQSYVLRAGEEFTVGTPSTGVDKYLVKTVDEQKNRVVVTDAAGHSYRIGSRPQVSAPSKASAAEDEADERMPGVPFDFTPPGRMLRGSQDE